MEAFGNGVDLGAVAGAEHHGLTNVDPTGEAGNGLGKRLDGNGHALKQGQWPRTVIHANNHDGHVFGNLSCLW